MIDLTLSKFELSVHWVTLFVFLFSQQETLSLYLNSDMTRDRLYRLLDHTALAVTVSAREKTQAMTVMVRNKHIANIDAKRIGRGMLDVTSCCWNCGGRVPKLATSQ